MVVLPSGSFRIGALSEPETKAHGDATPVTSIQIASFSISASEITRDQYQAFVNSAEYNTLSDKSGCTSWVDWDTGLQFNQELSWQNPGFSQNGSHPVTCINWHDASAYTNWLSEKTGKTYRLVSEAEWEYAARANTETDFSFGNSLDDICAHANISDKSAQAEKAVLTPILCDDGHAKTSPVKSYKPNAFGLYDMHGNLWEWVADCYHKNYDVLPLDGSALITDCAQRKEETLQVLRGGGWEAWDRMMSSASRMAFPSTVRKDDFGFRVARDIQ